MNKSAVGANSYRDLTEDEIAQALTYLDAGCDREYWFQIACAIKSELGNTGYRLFEDWSRTAPHKFNSADCRDTWKSAKAQGGITIATLIYEAQQFGFQLDESQREPLDTAAIEERRRKREAEEEAARLERERKRAMAAERAKAIWELAHDVEGDGHPYLQRKGVQSFGLRIGKWRNGQDALLVPINNIDGHLVSLQAIFANDNADIGRDRDYLPGGQKRNAFYLVGGKPIGASPTIVVCEGYSTAASIHMATGYSVAAAFDAGNVPHTARAMRELFGAATIIIAADNDQFHKAGVRNDGIHYARQAASSAGAILCVPQFDSLDGNPTDFNDLHARQGLDAVREQIEGCIPRAANDNHLSLDSSVNTFQFPHLSDRQQPLNTWENLAWMLDQYGITARYNVISKDVDVTIPGRTYGADAAANCALAEITSLCARNRMPKADTSDYLKLIANQAQYNPVADFILAKPWDGVSRLPDLYLTLETAPDYDRDLMQLLVRRWMISAVASALMPSGFWSKGVLVLQGPQSEGKTSWFKSLVTPEHRHLIKVGANIDPTNKDSISSAIGHWMVELGELDGTFRKADIAKLKAFISQDVDMLRRPYDRLESRYQRRTVFFASVNPDRFLADETGNVRWWTIPITGLDYEHDIDVQQLWAEVATLYRAGERWWLDRDEEARLEGVNREHESIDPLEELLLQRYDWNRAGQGMEATATDVLIQLGFDRPTKSQATDCSRLLQKLTGAKARKSGSRRLFKMPPKVREEYDPPY